MAGDKGKLAAVALTPTGIGKHFDSDGLFLHLTAQGGRYWRLAYNRAKHLPERRKMMQAWSDYLDKLRVGAEVMPIKRKAG